MAPAPGPSGDAKVRKSDAGAATEHPGIVNKDKEADAGQSVLQFENNDFKSLCKLSKFIP